MDFLLSQAIQCLLPKSSDHYELKILVSSLKEKTLNSPGMEDAKDRTHEARQTATNILLQKWYKHFPEAKAPAFNALILIYPPNWMSWAIDDTVDYFASGACEDDDLEGCYFNHMMTQELLNLEGFIDEALTAPTVN